MSRFEIPDSAVEAGLKVWFGANFETGDVTAEVYGSDFRAALAAALPMILGEPAAWVPLHFFAPGTFASTARRKQPSGISVELHGEYLPLYAPKPSKEGE